MGLANRYIDEPPPSAESVEKKRIEVVFTREDVNTSESVLTTASSAVEQPSHRIGMYLNYKVGRIKLVTSKRFGERQHVLIDVMEKCKDRDGMIYDAHYNMWITVGDEFQISRDMLHRWCLVGFHQHSLRNKALNYVYDNHYVMKRFTLLEDEDADSAAMQISDSIKPISL